MRWFTLLAILFVLVPVRVWARVVPDLLVELPSPDLLRRGEREIDSRLLVRRTGSGIYLNLKEATAVSEELRFRRGLASGLELAVAGRLATLSATSIDTPFRSGSSGMPAVSAEVKFRLPDTILGASIVFGTGASLIGPDDRALEQPDDYARLNPTYMLISRPFAEIWRGSLVFRRSRVFSTDHNDGTNLTTFDAALECAVPGWPRVQLELLSEHVGTRPIGDYGESPGFDGRTVNLGLRQQLSPTAAVQAYVRRLNRPDNLEVGLWCGLALPSPNVSPMRDIREEEIPGAITVVPVLGVGGYHPSSTKAGFEPEASLGVRLHDPSPTPFSFESVDYGLITHRWTSKFEEVRIVEAEVLGFYPQSPVFDFAHHFFYGFGAGASEVVRDGARLTLRPVTSFSGGLAVHVAGGSLEARLRLVLGPHDAHFDVSGTALELAASVPFAF